MTYRLRVVEIGKVSPPCILDFANSTLDTPPDVDEFMFRELRTKQAEDFEDNWGTAKLCLAELRSYRIFMNDVNTGNIMFPQ
jgi:hypothetical protein